MRKVLSVIGVLALCTWIGTSALTPAEWRMGGQNLFNTRHQPAEQRVNPTNVSRLVPKWVFTTGGDVSTTPAVVDGAVYFPDWGGNLFKVDAQTGNKVWSRRIQDYTSMPGSLSRVTPAVTEDALYLGTQFGATMLAVRKDTGELIWKTKLDDHFQATITQSAVVFQQRVYVGTSSEEEIYAALVQDYPCCTFRGSVVALDALTGSVIWKTPMTLNNNGVPGGFSGVPVWGSTPVVDAARNTLYVTTGNNYDVPAEVKACQKKHEFNPSLPPCGVPGNYVDAVVALDLNTGTVKWSTSLIDGYDAWTVACSFPGGKRKNCPDPKGKDFDFGQGAMLFTVYRNGSYQDLLGVGQKSGMFWALNPDTGRVRWSTVVGPPGPLGGMEWGSATDGNRIYVANTKADLEPVKLETSGVTTSGGAWSALDAATGQILWQTPTPGTARVLAPVTVANGVVYAATMALMGDNMFALDAATGAILWRFASGGSVLAGAAVVDGTVYWGSGYLRKGLGTPNNKLYAFGLRE